MHTENISYLLHNSLNMWTMTNCEINMNTNYITKRSTIIMFDSILIDSPISHSVMNNHFVLSWSIIPLNAFSLWLSSLSWNITFPQNYFQCWNPNSHKKFVFFSSLQRGEDERKRKKESMCSKRIAV